MSLSAQTPIAGFSATPVTGCGPLPVSFTDQSSGNPTSWQWDLGNGTLSTQQNPTTTYFNPGSYTVTLTVINANGSNAVTKTNYITVSEKPTVNFTVSDSVGCFPLRANFTDLSAAGSGTIASWEWDFGDGGISNVQHPFHLFTTAGNYTVTLKVTNSDGCVKVFSKPFYIQVSPGVTVNFTNPPAQLCHPPETINFTNLSTGPGTLNFLWDFGEGGTSAIPNPAHTYTIGGSFPVSLIVQSSLGCIDTLVRPAGVVINDVQINIGGPDSICVDQQATFQNNSLPLPATSFWDFGDGTTSTQANPTKTWMVAGTYQMKLVSNYSTCADSLIKTIRVSALPSVNFTANDSIDCSAPFLVNFQDLSTGASIWNWDFGDGATATSQNPSHTYTAAGNYTVKLIATNISGCSDSLINTQFIRINAPIVAINGLPVEGCIPYTLNPTANVTAVDGIASYSWDFGDGATSVLQNPSHTYTAQGTYTVKLIITTNDGCTDSAVIAGAVRVGTIPFVDFTAAPLSQCAGQPVQFTDLSLPSDRWLWDFGDGGTSTIKDPAYSYADTGTYTVRLTAWNNGCSTSVSKNNFITALPPVARFSTSYDCNNKKQATFTDQSVLPQSWTWDFGDGATSTLQNPVHVYAAYGIYTVTLTVTNSSCSNTVGHSVVLFNEMADFAVADDTLCKSENAIFTLQNVNAANIASSTWYFGDGSSATTGPAQLSATHVYINSGLFTVKVLITDIRGCIDSTTKSNIIQVWGPTVNFTSTPPTGCRGMTVTFNDLSTTDGFHPITRLWDFKDGQTQNFTAPPFTHLYDTAGTFFPALRITDTYGCSQAITTTTIFITDPLANFNSTDTLTCIGKNVSFNNASIGNSLTYGWSFGDGNSSVQLNPTTVYAADGNYHIKLIVTDINGCVDSLQLNDYIKVRTTQPSFTVSDSASSCTPFEVIFTNTSANTVSQLWDFGDGSTSTLPNPSHYYTVTGTYFIKLYTTGPGGCTDSTMRSITLYSPIATLSYSPLLGCSPLAVNFHVSTAGPVTYLWDLNDGNTLTVTDSNLVYNYLLPGNFLPKVILADPTGCLIPLTGIDTISVTKSNVNFSADDSVLCDAGIVNFTDSTISNGSVSSYQWNFGDGGTATIANPSHLYVSPGLYNVQLIVSTANGCSDTLIKTNYISVVRSPSIGITGNVPVCMPGVLSFRGVLTQPDTSIINWQWTFGNGISAAGQNPAAQRYDSAGNYILQLIGTNSSGCVDTVNETVIIYPLPVVNAGPDKTTAVGTSVLLTSTSSPGVSYLWTPAATLNCSTCPAPTATPKTNTTYLVKVTDANGCVNSDQVTVFVTCNNDNVFIPNAFSPNNDGLNDVFYPKGKGLYKIQRMQIFNRWGELLFTNGNFLPNSPSDGWNGFIKGKQANIDVYAYIIEVICDNNTVINLKGNITLIR